MHRSRFQVNIGYITEMFAKGIVDYNKDIPMIHSTLLRKVQWLEDRKYDLDEAHYRAYEMHAISAGDTIHQLSRSAAYACRGQLDTERKRRKALRYAATAHVLLQDMALLVLQANARHPESFFRTADEQAIE